MHIPTCQTQELEILTFEQALVPTQWDFDREKWLYIPDHYAEYRYLLGTRGVSGSTPPPRCRGTWTIR